MSKRVIIGAISAAALSAAAASPAAATVILNIGPGVLQPEENLLFNNDPVPGLTIEGVTNQTATLVTIEGGETLQAAGGQARLDTADGAISTSFAFRGFADQLLGFDFSDAALAFTSTEFRLVGGTATQITLTFVDTAGEIFQQTFARPKSRFFNAVAIDGQLIDYFSISANGSIDDVRQIRIGGVQSIGVVPEPATWAMMLMGFGAAGAAFRARRRMVLA